MPCLRGEHKEDLREKFLVEFRRQRDPPAAEEENTSELCATVQATTAVSGESGEEFLVDGEKDMVVPSQRQRRKGPLNLKCFHGKESNEHVVSDEHAVETCEPGAFVNPRVPVDCLGFLRNKF